MRRFSLLCLTVTGIALSGDAPANACEFVPLEPHTVDPAEQKVDTEPPGKATGACSISRRYGPQSAGCGKTASSSCDPDGSVRIEVSATDDRTDAAGMGFRIELVGGKLPDGLALPADAVRSQGDSVFLHFPDQAPDDQESIEFSIKIVAIDRAGNESAASDAVACKHAGDD